MTVVQQGTRLLYHTNQGNVFKCRPLRLKQIITPMLPIVSRDVNMTDRKPGLTKNSFVNPKS